MEHEQLDFWQNHSEHFLEMAFNSNKRERIEKPNGYGKRTGTCGDTIEMFLIISDGCIQTASFDTDGCLNTMACANTVVHFVERKTLEEAWGISVEMVVSYLETLPAENIHCAELAVGALYLALSDISEDKVDGHGVNVDEKMG